MNDLFKRMMDRLLKVMAWINENRPEFAWPATVGYMDDINEDGVYKAKFYGLRLRSGAKWGIGFTKCGELLDEEGEKHYYNFIGLDDMEVMDDGEEAEWSDSTDHLSDMDDRASSDGHLSDVKKLIDPEKDAKSD